MEHVTCGASAWQATLHEVLAHQVLAKMIPKLADKLHKAEKRVCFRMHSGTCVRVCCKLIIDWCIYLIHALHILDPRIQLRIDEQGSLDFLNFSLACQRLYDWGRTIHYQFAATQDADQCCIPPYVA